MPRTRKQYIGWIIIAAVTSCSWAVAEDAPVNPYSSSEIEALINGITGPQTSSEDWGDRNPFDTTDIQDLVGKPGGNQKPGMNKSTIILQGIFLGSQKPSAII